MKMKEEIIQDIKKMSNIMDNDIIRRKLNRTLNTDETYPQPRKEDKQEIQEQTTYAAEYADEQQTKGNNRWKENITPLEIQNKEEKIEQQKKHRKEQL